MHINIYPHAQTRSGPSALSQACPPDTEIP
jgi:hypothetical protein